MNFFSSIFIKNKKTVYVIILFFVISGLIIPSISLANIFGDVGALFAKGSYETGLGDVAKNTVNGLLTAGGILLTSITSGLRDIAFELMNVLMNENNYFSYTGPDNPVISVGWTASRDLANMFIVLGFVIIGIATTLRIQEYQAKKLLLKLIIVALLINFSLLICGIFIDGSNITMIHFLKSGRATQDSMVKNIVNQAQALTNAYKGQAEPSVILAMAAGIVFHNIMAFIIFILFAFLFVFRHIALWILVMLSPLAFVFYVFPFTKKFFEMWWNNFFQWCIIGIPGAFTMFLADKITEHYTAAQMDDGFLVFFVPGLFLIVGFIFSLQTSAMGAGFITGAAKKATSWGQGQAWSGAKKLGGAALDKSGASRVGNAIKSKVTSVGESLRLIKPGTNAANQQEALKSKGRTNRLDAMSSDGLAQVANRGAIGREANLDKARATEMLFKQGKIGKIKNIESAIAHAESYGADKNDLYKHPLTAQYNKTKVAEYMKPIAKGGKGLSQGAAKQQLTNEAYQKADNKTLKELPSEAINETFMKTVMLKNPTKMAEIAKDTPQENIEAIKKWKTKHDNTGKVLSLVQQSPEFVKLFNEMKALPLGSPERMALRKQMSEMQKMLQNNSIFV